MNEIIMDAIRNKKVLQFYYDDKFRIVEPHVYGSSKKKDGGDLLRAYQVMGDSTSTNELGWRLFSVDNINLDDLSLSGNSFTGEREYYNPKDKAMKEIYINL